MTNVISDEDIETKILFAAIAAGRTRHDHEIAKSDPSRNGTTGRAVYLAETRFNEIMTDLLTNHREAINRIDARTRKSKDL